MTLMQESSGFQPRTGNSTEDRMPLPKPHPDEQRDDFVARCLADPATKEMQGTDDQRVAACERQFDDAKKDAELSDVFGMKAVSNVTLADEGKVTAVVATMDQVDNDGEVILSGAIADGTKATVSMYNHDTVMGMMLGTGKPDAPPVGKGTITVEGKQAVFRGQYFMDTQRGKEGFLTVKAMGSDQAWSFAYRQKREPPTAEWKAKGARAMLTKLEPLLDGAMEVSPVKMPGGKGTGTLAVKSSTAEASVDAGDASSLEPAKKSAADQLLEARIARVRRSIGKR